MVPDRSETVRLVSVQKRGRSQTWPCRVSSAAGGISGRLWAAGRPGGAARPGPGSAACGRRVPARACLAQPAATAPARLAGPAPRDRPKPRQSSLAVGYATAWLRLNTKQATGPLRQLPGGHPAPLFRRRSRTANIKNPTAGGPGIGAQFVSFNFMNNLICRIVSSEAQLGAPARSDLLCAAARCYQCSLKFRVSSKGCTPRRLPANNRRFFACTVNDVRRDRRQITGEHRAENRNRVYQP
jgi:hypothetical protein